MKKLFFLFAAAALLTACSSDELSETTGGGGTPTNPDTEQYVSSGTVEFANGTSMSLGMFDENGNPVTRAGETVNFTIDLELLQDEIFDDVESYVLKADDFAIRKDGVYLDPDTATIDGGNEAKILENVLINTQKIFDGTESFLVSVNGLQNLDFEPKTDKDGNVIGYPNYSFEAYIWIENKELKDDGTGGYGELFQDEDKFDWIGVTSGIKNKTYAEWLAENPKAETGQDWSKAIFEAKDAKYSEGGDLYNGLVVRYNVYRGLQGRNGDTPYIKVSVSVDKELPTTVGEKKNDFTYVNSGSDNNAVAPHKSLSKDSSDILSVK